MIFVFILFGALMPEISTYKSDTFPPMAKVKKYYDIDHFAKVCYEKSGADKNELHEFEVTTDLDRLPNSHAMKVYLRCFAEISEAVEQQSNKVVLTKFLKYFNELTSAEQLIYVNMGRGCFGRASKITDPLEYSYTILVCAFSYLLLTVSVVTIPLLYLYCFGQLIQTPHRQQTQQINQMT